MILLADRRKSFNINGKSFNLNYKLINIIVYQVKDNKYGSKFDKGRFYSL